MMLHAGIRRVATGLALAALTLSLVPGLVLGHAELETATPADDSSIDQPVTEVSGTFSQRMDPDTSKLTVKLVGGGTVAEGRVDPDDDQLMVAIPDTPLGSGDYQVEWVTLSVEDDEIARGTWTFTVAVTATPSPSPTPAPTPTAAPSAAVTPAPTLVPATPVPSVAPTPAPSGDGSATGNASDVVLPIIIALVVLGAGAAYLLTRRTRPTDEA